MDSGVAPVLLKKNQAAALVNATVRGAFAKTRPAYQRCTLTFASADLQALVERTLFQGCGYYRPDFGVEQLLAQLGGRLFAFTESGSGSRNFNVTDISVPGDVDDPTVGQAWMWQSEKWMIISDGTAKLPIFYDGTSSRRSYGPSVLLATIDTDFLAVDIGDTVTVHLSAPYTGPFNVPVLVNGFFYQTVGSGAGGYAAILTNLTDTPGATVPSGSNIVVQPDSIGYIQTLTTGHFFGPYLGYSDQYKIGFANAHGLGVGDALTIPTYGNPGHCGGNVTVGSVISATEIATVHPCFGGFNQGNFQVGDLVQRASSAGPNVIVAITAADFVAPAVGANVTAAIDREYSGASGQSVWINGKLYTIAPAPPPGPSVNLDLINLTDPTTPGDTISQPKEILSVPELPAGRMGAYGLGQNWMSLTDGLSFIVSDPVGGASGTPANNYRDAVLKYTELTFRGGAFRVPSSGTIITSMTFTSVLDTSLGQGSLIVGTDSGMYSCIAPVDFTSLPNINGPILTASLIGQGPLGQNSTVLVNSDILFRINPGLASLILARREFTTWGNTPISHEMEVIFDQDDRTLLQYSSAMVFNNRHLVTARPQVGPQGVFHSGLVTMNLDPVSSLRGKANPVYDGAWSGLNVLQLVQGKINGAQRSFAFSYNVTDQKIELYELLADGIESADNGTTAIPMVIETSVLFNQDVKPVNELVRLVNGELFLKDIIGTVHIKVSYKPDFYPCFVTWREWDVCQKETDSESKPGYRTRIGIGEPPDVPCEEGNNRPLNVGHFFQFRIELTGSVTFMALRVQAAQEPISDFAAPECEEVCP